MRIFAKLFEKAKRQPFTRRTCRPFLEILEDRLCLAGNVYAVDLFTDDNVAGGGTMDGPNKGDLRWCINQARANPGSEIDIPVTAFTGILIQAELPHINQTTKLIGSADVSGNPLVLIYANGTFDGLTVEATGCVIKSLDIADFIGSRE
jgi:hypothetical protein